MKRTIKFCSVLVLALLLSVACDEPAGAASMEEMQASTVRILCKNKDALFSGSGFVVAAGRNTYVATNRHVAVCAKPGEEQRLLIVLNRADFVPIQVVWSDADKDLAIVRSTRPLDRPAVKFADTTLVTAGMSVTVVGFPGAADNVVDTEDIAVPSVTRGTVGRIISSVSSGIQYFQHSAATNPGNSGGPVYDEAGNVIGVNSLKALALVASISRGQVSTDRIANGEGIAEAIDAAELLPHLKALEVPYVMASSTFTAMNISLMILAATVPLLLGAGGILVATSSGRDAVFRRKRRPDSRAAAKVQTGRIRVLDGSLAGLEISVSSAVVLGRDPAQAQIVFPEGDTSVSRRHCEIRFDSATALFEVRDLGSRNGTFLANGGDKPRRLAAEVVERLGPGQKILLGSPRNRLVLELD